MRVCGDQTAINLNPPSAAVDEERATEKAVALPCLRCCHISGDVVFTLPIHV